VANFYLKIIICLFALQHSYSQDSILVKSVVDTTSIKVGEQFSYNIIVESDNFQEINFPDNFNFSPFTIANQFPADTNYLKSKKIISKKFNLTHFDEGSYSISPQKLSIGKEIYTTEKIDIDVITIKVDTVSKKFFDIKEIKFTDDPNSSIFKIISPIALFILGCLVLFFIYKSYKKLKSTEFFFQTPFEKAVLSLQEIEKSKLDNQKDLKEFYTRLIEIVKRYFEDDSINPNSMESTSNQLISKLKLLKTSKKINLQQNTINSLAEVLGNSDLVKFARLEMDQNTITNDQIKIKEVISSAKKSIPNNEQKDNEKRKREELKFLNKLKNKKIRYILSSAITVILTILAIVIFLFGTPKSIDSITFNTDKKLLNQDWVESVYTEFNLRVQTPDALIRSSDSLSNDLNYVSKDGSISINLYVKTKTENQDVLNGLLDGFKRRNFKNIITKEEQLDIGDGNKANKIFGSFDDNNINAKKNYNVIIFDFNNKSLFLEMIYEIDNNIQRKIIDRILNSLKFEK
tara:strand:- start:21 stop:1574 length:1554 start_codon:yes stop_codon:yes gene_type:complete